MVSVIALDPIVEEGSEASFMITADDPYANVTVGFRTVGGSAIENTDFTGVNDSRTFTGSTTVSVTTLHDFLYETYETFSLELTSAIGAEIDPESDVAETVIDNDTAIVSNVRALEGIKNPDRIVTNATLELIQGDVVTFRAEPPEGGTLDEDDIVWKVTGQPDVTGTSRTVAFTEFMDFVAVCAQTLDASSVACVTVELVPHPTGIETTHGSPVMPAAPFWMQGAWFTHDITPSEGADGNDLEAANLADKLLLSERVVVMENSIQANANLSANPGTTLFVLIGSETTANMVSDELKLDNDDRFVGKHQGADGSFPALPKSITVQKDFVFKAIAADSPRDGQWIDFESDISSKFELDTLQNTFIIRVVENGTEVVSFYSGGVLATALIVPPPGIRDIAGSPPTPVYTGVKLVGSFVSPGFPK